MKRLVLWLVAAFLPAAIGAPFPAPDYYRSLQKPSWAPPPWIFGPVWSVLYALIGTSAWLVSRRGGAGTRTALTLWWVQLALNAAWTPIFFGARSRGWALVEIVVTWAVVVSTTVVFFTRRTAAGLVLLPYLAWVTFASALNFVVWRDN
jgi:benzodiazapine receptor